MTVIVLGVPMGWNWEAGDPCEPHEAEWCAACNPNVTRTITRPKPSPKSQWVDPGDATRRPWETEDAAVLVALYFKLPFYAGDDSQAENHAIAHALQRSPAAIDRQWRNIQDVEKQQQVQHVGRLVIDTVERYLADPAREHARAVEICRRRRWKHLEMLLVRP